MSTTAPDWADAALVQRALRKGGRSDVHVLGVETQPLCGPGENFASRLFRLRARVAAAPGEDKGENTVSLVIKCEAEDEVMRENMRRLLFFSKEIFCLSEVIPQIQEMLETAAPGRYPPLAPRCLLHGQDPYGFIIMEDLSERGYHMADRIRGLGLRHSLLAITTLARFHGASVAVLARDPSIASRRLPSPWMTSREDPFSNVIRASLLKAAEACREWEDFPKEYADFLERISSKAYEKFSSLCEPIPGGFNVINHADYWTNNILFRYEDGVPVETRMIDFQITSISSPSMDILRFLYSSLQEDVLENHLDLLIREYHKSLQDTLEVIGIKSPSLEELWNDINLHGFYALFGVFSLPFMRSEKGKAPDMEIAYKNGGIETDVFRSPRFSRWLKRVLVDFRTRGWIREDEFL